MQTKKHAKKHERPEFTVIKQDMANAKFFVASGGVPFTGMKSASNYGDGGNISL